MLVSTIWVQTPLRGCTLGDENDVVLACAGIGGGNVERVRITDDVWTVDIEIVFDASGRDGGGGDGGSGGRRCGEQVLRKGDRR